MRRNLLLLLPLLACVPALAQTTCQELVPKIMDASGLNQQLAAVPTIMRETTSSAFDREGSMPVDAKRELESLMDNAFDIHRVSTNISTKLVASCEPKAYAAVLSDLQSPLAQKMVQLELEPLSSPEAAKRLQHYVASFPMQSPRESRMDLIYKMMDATKEAETETDEVIQLTLTMTRTAFNYSPSQNEIDTVRQQTLEKMRDITAARMYYLFRSASDQELQQLIAMQSKPETQKINRDAANAMLYAFQQEAVDLGGKMKKVVHDERVKHVGE